MGLSSGPADDAIQSYARLRSTARALETLSSSVRAIAVDVTSAYFAALTNSDPAAWTRFVGACATLTRCLAALDGIITLDDRESEALVFFEAIVRENQDLLDFNVVVDADVPFAYERVAQ